MFSDKSDWSDKSDILLRELLIGLVRPVGLFLAPIKPLKNLKWQQSTPPYGGDGGGFPLVCGGLSTQQKSTHVGGCF